jgi:hypothetical protein
MKKIVKNFNNLIKKTIFNVQNKTNDKLILFKVKNKTNNKLLISKFNKYLITFISLLFFYLFYLSIPVLYDKNWVQKKIENQLLKDFKVEFSLSSDISYRILPSPHYLVKDSKIVKEGNKTETLAKIKNLKVFVSQKNLFDKEKMSLKYVKINNADFTLLAADLKLLKNDIDNKFSDKKIKINKSNIFFKNNSDETVFIIKISEAFLYQDLENLSNLFNLKGEIFSIPFNFDYNRKLDSSNNEVFNINAKTLKLNIFNTSNVEEDKNNDGNNTISFLNSKIITNYKIKNSTMTFNSVNSRIQNSKVDYEGKLSTDPLDLDLNINLDNLDFSKLFNNNSILNELIRTELLFNENLSVSISITTNSNLKNKIFQDTKIYFNIIDAKLNFDKTTLINKKIGKLELVNSDLSFESERLVLNTDIIISINNSSELFSLLKTNKKFRKPITNILINLDYDFLSNEIDFNNIKIDNKEIDDELSRIIEGFNDKGLNNWNKSKRILNNFFKIYEG